MEKDVPDTKHTQQDNISFTKVAKFTALARVSDQPQIILCSLNRSSIRADLVVFHCNSVLKNGHKQTQGIKNGRA